MHLGVTVEGKGRIIRPSGGPDFSQSYDVAVVGLGTAGAPALEKSVSFGFKCLGLEKTGGMGGQSTVGCISWAPVIVRDLARYERNCLAADVMYGAAPVGVWIDNGRIVGLRYVRNGIVKDVAVKVVIDASGNASVAKMCSLPVRKGRDFDGVMATCARGESWVGRKGGGASPIYGGFSDSLACNNADYSAVVGKMGCARHRFWKSHTAKARMLRPSALVNAREEERVVAETVVSLRDALAGRSFPDPIMHAWTPEDLPVFYGDYAFESDETQNWKVLCGLPMFGFPSTIPYGSIVAKGMDNLLVPSKHFGVSHDLGGGLRMQAEMRKSGLAAACAAKVMLERNCSAKSVPYGELRPLLEAAGTLAPPRKTRMTTYAGHEFEPFSGDQVVAALGIGVLRTDEWWQGAKGKCTDSLAERAAYALWTCWNTALNGSPEERASLAERLLAKVREAGKFAGNFAVALGLMGDRRAVPMLRKMVEEPGGEIDPVVRGALPNRIKAILLLGRFRDRGIMSALRRIILGGADEFMRDLYGKAAWSTDSDCRFQALSYAAMAMKAILAEHPNGVVMEEMRSWARGNLSFKRDGGVDLADRLRKVFS